MDNGMMGNATQRLLADALVQHQAGQLEPAMLLYRRLLTLQPDHADGLHLLGVAERRLGNLAYGLILLGRTHRLAPKLPGSTSNRTGALNDARQAVVKAHRDGRLMDMLDLLNAIAAAGEADDGIRTARLRVAMVLQDQAIGDLSAGRTREACTLARRLLPLLPDSATLFHTLALSARWEGQTEKARVGLRQALSLDPALIAAYAAQARMADEAGDYKNAVVGWRRASRLAPDHPAAIAAWGEAASRRGDVSTAVACFRHVTTIDPTHAGCLYALGMTLDHAGALTACDRALRITPSDGTMRLSHIHLLIHNGRNEDAAEAALIMLDRAESDTAGSWFSREALRAAALLVDFSIFDKRVFARSMTLARREYRYNQRNTPAFYVLAYQLYVDGRISLLNRLLKHFLKQWTSDDITSDIYIRYWVICQFDHCFFHSLDRNPGPESQLPTWSWYGDINRFDRPILFLSCDDRYWKIYGNDLIKSILLRCTDPAVHVNLMDPSPETLADLDRWQASTGGRINITVEPLDDSGLPYRIDPIRKIYFSCVRLIRLARLLETYALPMVMLDLDCLVHDDLYRLLARLDQPDLALFRAPLFGPTREIIAGFLYLDPGPIARRYIWTVARYIMDAIVSGQAQWMLDQAALYCTLHHQSQSRQPPAVVSVTDSLMRYCRYDYRYDKQPLVPEF